MFRVVHHIIELSQSSVQFLYVVGRDGQMGVPDLVVVGDTFYVAILVQAATSGWFKLPK